MGAFLNKNYALQFACFILLMAALLPLPAFAYTGVTIVMSTASTTNLDFIESFKNALTIDKKQALKVTVINLSEVDQLKVAENSELVIALGVKALAESGKLKYTTPVLGVFTPLPTFNRLLFKTGRRLGNFSAIVLDQPYRRQIGLARIALPKAKNLGILLGTTSSRYEEFLQASAERGGFSAHLEEIQSEAGLIPKLEKIFDTSDALLAIPDPLVYNRETAQPILLTSYRHGVPVFGYSRSYVKAGALASVFSNAMHLAQQAAEIAVASQKKANILPPPQAPKYFSVIINRQVQRSLNLKIADQNVIYQELLKLESEQSTRVQN